MIERHCDPLIEPTQSRKKKESTIQDEFFGVYCLISRSDHKSYKNRCYVGYTVDPNRRVRQHNAGKEFGGAKKTDSRGPWDMVCIVHGFPNSVSALRFEWAWQNPMQSKRIRDLLLKKAGRKETPFQFHLRIVSHMLNVDPWQRLSLTFRWLVPKEKIDFPVPLPRHMKVVEGLVEKTNTVIPQQLKDYTFLGICSICNMQVNEISSLLECLVDGCRQAFHNHCLAELGLKNISEPMLFPVKVSCPCNHTHFWGDLVRRQRCLLAVDRAKPQFDGVKIADGMIPLFVRKL